MCGEAIIPTEQRTTVEPEGEVGTVFLFLCVHKAMKIDVGRGTVCEPNINWFMY